MARNRPAVPIRACPLTGAQRSGARGANLHQHVLCAEHADRLMDPRRSRDRIAICQAREPSRLNWVLNPCLKAMAEIKFDHYSHRRERTMFRKIMLAAFVVAFAGGAALAQETCDSKAVGKDGKPLAGAAKTSSIKKCMADTCATKAVSQDGKPLSGAAKTSFMKKCEKGA